jgi:hypothetical protein
VIKLSSVELARVSELPARKPADKPATVEAMPESPIKLLVAPPTKSVKPF